jgi:tetratricopeptide (TPR) repeat protein
MRPSTSRLVLHAVAGTLFPVLFAAQAAVGLSASSSAEEAQALNNRGQYAEALKAAEEGLKANPQDKGLVLAQVEALMGLGRYREAAPIALRMSSSDPRFRWESGMCAKAMGFYSNAVQMWAPLLDDPAWAPRAYQASVGALVAAGKSKEAKELLGKAFEVLPAPTKGLVEQALQTGGVKDLGPKVQKMAQKDASLAGLAEYLKDAPGPLYEFSLAGQLPSTIPVKEKAEEVYASSLTWGGSIGSADIHATGPQAPAQSSTSGYGSGFRDSASSEGGRTGTMSSLRRSTVPVKINGGKDEAMVLSTATPFVFLSQGAVRRQNLKVLQGGEYVGMGAESPVPCGRLIIQELKAGPLTVKNVPAFVIDDKVDFWKETGGILPFWLLRDYGVLYDRRKGALTLYPSGTPPQSVLGEGAFPVKTAWMGGMLFTEAKLQDKPNCLCLLDISCPSTYLLAPKLGELNLSVNVPRYGHRYEVGLLGKFSYDVAEKATVGVGTASFDMAAIRALGHDNTLPPESYGIIGRDVLDLFKLYADFGSGKTALAPYGK